MLRVSLATPGTKACDTVGGAFRRSEGRGQPPYCCISKWQTVSSFLLLTISRRGVFFLLVLRRNVLRADKPSDLVQGSLDMVILNRLAPEAVHRYGMAVRLEQMSKSLFRLCARSFCA